MLLIAGCLIGHAVALLFLKDKWTLYSWRYFWIPLITGVLLWITANSN